MDGLPTFMKMFGKFSVGIKTTADDVFIAPFDETTASGELVERELLHPLIRGKTIRRWQVTWDATNGYDRYVLYPHFRAVNGRTAPVDLGSYPLARAFLEMHRVRLGSRDYVINAGRQWYEIWVTQRISTLMAPRKLVFPDFATRSEFALDLTGAFVGSSAAFGVLCQRASIGMIFGSPSIWPIVPSTNIYIAVISEPQFWQSAFDSGRATSRSIRCRGPHIH